MTPEQVREIASKGGLAAHAKNAAHQWTSETARYAAQKSKEVRAARLTKAINNMTVPPTNQGASE